MSLVNFRKATYEEGGGVGLAGKLRRWTAAQIDRAFPGIRGDEEWWITFDDGLSVTIYPCPDDYEECPFHVGCKTAAFRVGHDDPEQHDAENARVVARIEALLDATGERPDESPLTVEEERSRCVRYLRSLVEQNRDMQHVAECWLLDAAERIERGEHVK